MATEGLAKQEVGDTEQTSPAASGPDAEPDLRVFNMENLSGLIQHGYDTSALAKVVAINGPTFVIPPLKECQTLLQQWETFGPKLDALCCIGLCARSPSLATIWTERLAQTEPESVDAVTAEGLLDFVKVLADDKKRYVLGQLRLFLDAKQEWRKLRIECECADFNRRMFDLFATGSVLSIPAEQFGAMVAKLEGFLGPDLDDGFVQFIKLFLVAVKTLQTDLTASSRDCAEMARIHVAALDACLKVLAQWPSEDVVGHSSMFKLLTSGVKVQMDTYIDQLRRKLEDF